MPIVKRLYLAASLVFPLVLTSGCQQSATNVRFDQQSGTGHAARSKAALTGPGYQFARCTDGLPKTGMWKCDPLFVDLNADGLLDMVALARLGDGPHAWLGDGTGSWSDASSGLVMDGGSCGGGLSVGDVNNDGYLDLAVADHCQGMFVYLGDGNAHWTAVTQELYPEERIPPGKDRSFYVGTEDIDLADVNLDGFLDIVSISNDAGGVNVFLGDGSGQGWTHDSVGLIGKGASNRVLFADVNKDGLPDIVAAHCLGPRVWLNDGRGAWQESFVGLPTPLMGCVYRGTAVGDINEDGRLDIATANWIDGPEVYLQQEDGSWRQTEDVFPSMLGGAVGLALGDVTGDGHLDLVVSGRLTKKVGFVYGVFLLIGDGTGHWEHDERSSLPSTGLAFTWGVAIDDINQDGRADIAAGSGGIVATRPGPTEPIVPDRLIVWCNQGPSNAD